MKKVLTTLIALVATASTALAIEANTVEIKFNGTTATVSKASNISSYVTVNSGTSAHVSITQDSTFVGVDASLDNEDGEIIYVLSGSCTNGSFTLEGSYKCQVTLNGLTLTNPSGPALNLQNGKRVSISISKGTTSSLADGANADYNGCIHCKGHLKLKGKGTLNISGNSKHAIYSKEYFEMKNATVNITSAQKDGLHCKEYLLMESGTLNISNTLEDGIQVETSNDPLTGITTDHEDENTGNFYMLDGTLTIASYGGKAIKADGSITYS
ncbi:MAG: carbohydrate-binding domain-containing protein, partial [Prevotella sp.]|nr:carbohydrate-binding domain-containing protein [Prevotella sp.]